MGRISIVLAVACGLLAAPAAASAATDAGVSGVSLADPRPGAVSLPFSVPITQSTIDPQPSEMRIAIEGFELDPGTASDRRIGSVDYDTDLGYYPGQWLTTGGGGSYLLEVPLGSPVRAALQQGTFLDESGSPVEADHSTLISFTLPGSLPLGAKLRTLAFQFNVDYQGLPTPQVGATNPAAGEYRIRSWVKAVDGSEKVATRKVTVGKPGPAGPKLKVKANRKRVAPGKKVRFRISLSDGPSKRVTVRTGGRVEARVKVGSRRAATYRWRAPRNPIASVQTFSFRARGLDPVERDIRLGG